MPNLHISDMVYLGGGSFATFRVNNDLIVKFPKDRGNDSEFIEQFAREIRLVPMLAERLQPHSIPAPRWQLAGPLPHFPGPIFGYGYLNGEQLTRLSLSVGEEARVAGLLGDFLRKLHGVGMDVAATLGIATATGEDVRRMWLAQYAPDQREVLPRLEPEERVWLDALCVRFLARGIVPEVALIHGDFGPENVLLPPEGDHLHVVDLEDLHIGPIAADFCLWAGAYGPAFVDAMLAAYQRPVDEQFLTVMQFCFDRIPLIYFRYGFAQDNAAFIAFGRKLLQQRMAHG